MASKSPFDEATKVTAEQGEVVLQGPDSIGLSMTPKAAAETGRRLRDGAEQARKQAERRKSSSPASDPPPK